MLFIFKLTQFVILSITFVVMVSHEIVLGKFAINTSISDEVLSSFTQDLRQTIFLFLGLEGEVFVTFGFLRDECATDNIRSVSSIIASSTDTCVTLIQLLLNSKSLFFFYI